MTLISIRAIFAIFLDLALIIERIARKKMTRATHFFSLPERASFGDCHCTHVTAYFVVPTGADIIYTAEYRPERDISFQKNIFQSGERASGEKIPPPGLRPGILTLPAAVSVVCCAYETGMCTSISVSSRKRAGKSMSFCFLSLLSPSSSSLCLSLSLSLFVRLHIHLPSGEKGINSSVWIKPIRAERNAAATRKKRAPRHERFNAEGQGCRDGDGKNSAVIPRAVRKKFLPAVRENIFNHFYGRKFSI